MHNFVHMQYASSLRRPKGPNAGCRCATTCPQAQPAWLRSAVKVHFCIIPTVSRSLQGRSRLYTRCRDSRSAYHRVVRSPSWKLPITPRIRYQITGTRCRTHTTPIRFAFSGADEHFVGRFSRDMAPFKSRKSTASKANVSKRWDKSARDHDADPDAAGEGLPHSLGCAHACIDRTRLSRL